jgi:hypothetical protein
MTAITRGVVAAASIALLCACSGAPKVRGEPEVAAKRFEAPPRGEAALYVYRRERYGGGVRMSLSLDGRHVADTTGRSFVRLVVPAGTHRLVSTAENESVLDLQLRSGETYFVWQEAKIGLWSQRTELHVVDEATGKAGVGKCTMIDEAAPQAR